MINREGTKKIIKASILLIISFVIIGYSYFASRDYIKGPEIIIFEPQNGSALSTSTVIVKGQALRIQEITFNNRPILIDEQGNFTETLLLFPGYNISVIYAKDKFDRSTEYKIELVYED